MKERNYTSLTNIKLKLNVKQMLKSFWQLRLESVYSGSDRFFESDCMDIRFYETLRQVVGKKSDSFDCQPCCTQKTLINQAVGRYPELAHELYDAEGKLRRHIRIFVNNKDLSYRDQLLEIKVQKKDVIEIFPVVSGGIKNLPEVPKPPGGLPLGLDD